MRERLERSSAVWVCVLVGMGGLDCARRPVPTPAGATSPPGIAAPNPSVPCPPSHSLAYDVSGRGRLVAAWPEGDRIFSCVVYPTGDQACMSVGFRGDCPRLERSDAKGQAPPLRQYALPQVSPDGGVSLSFNEAAITLVDARTGRPRKRVPLPPEEGAHHYLEFEGWLGDAQLFLSGSAPQDLTREGLPWCNLLVTRLLDASPSDSLDSAVAISDRCEHWTFSTEAGAVALLSGRGNEVDFFDGPPVRRVTRLKTGRSVDTEPIVVWRDSAGMLVLVYGISIPPAVVRIDIERRVVVSAVGPESGPYKENALCQTEVAAGGLEYGPRCRMRPPGQW